MIFWLNYRLIRESNQKQTNVQEIMTETIASIFSISCWKTRIKVGDHGIWQKTHPHMYAQKYFQHFDYSRKLNSV